MNSLHKFFPLLSIICIIVAGWLAFQMIQKSSVYTESKVQYASERNYKERLLNVDEWLKGNTKTNYSITKDIYLDNYAVIVKYGLGLFGLMGIYALCSMLLFKVREQKLQNAFTLLVIAFVFLIPGLFTPLLEIGAYEKDLAIPIEVDLGFIKVDATDIKFDGELYFYYQSKSIVELITLLLKNGNMIVGISILIFSVLIPLIKLFASFYMLMQKEVHHTKLKKWIAAIGKWSMADVFVAAVFLAFLAFNNMQTGIQTDSNTLIGLYFFLGYCILSISSSMVVEKVLSERVI